MDQSEKALLATLCYSDVFDYPLTKAQLWRYLITRKKVSFAAFLTALEKGKMVQVKNNLYYLRGRGHITTVKDLRAKYSKRKLQKIAPVLRLLTKIPTISLIGISGSLAMENADSTADIDLFLITKANTLWITRLLVLVIFQLKNVRRKRQQQKAHSTICLNMLVDTKHIAFPTKRHDMYTAHEIVQMKPFFSRAYTYEKFLLANAWVSEYLPNSIPLGVLKKMILAKKERQSLFGIFEPSAKFLQLWYMRRHRTTETITNGFVAFHPLDYRQEVLLAWEKRKKKYV